jgi:hypothetical protein
MFETVPTYEAAPSLSLRRRGWLHQHTRIHDTNPRALDPDQLLELTTAINIDKARLDAKLCDTAVVFALRHTRTDDDVVCNAERVHRYGGDGTPQTSDFCISELANALHCSETAATDYLSVGLDLDYRLPHTHSEFRAGRLDYPHAKVISEVTRDLPLADAEQLDDRLADAAAHRTPSELRAYARRAIARLHPAVDEQRAKDAFANRETRVFDNGYGMGVFWMSNSLDNLARIDQHLTTLAKNDRAHAHSDDHRTLEQRRADIATRLLLGQPVMPGDTDRDDLSHLTTVVKLTMTADSLLGTEDQPAALDGYGPITAEQARRLALQSASTVLRRIFTDPIDDSVMTYDAHSYTFTPTQIDAIRARYPRCVFPGCRARAARCDTDHRDPYRRGPNGTADPPGQTVVDNGQPLCRRHHRLKTFAGWTVVKLDNRYLRWTSPTGRTTIVDTKQLE